MPSESPQTLREELDPKAKQAPHLVTKAPGHKERLHLFACVPKLFQTRGLFFFWRGGGESKEGGSKGEEGATDP